MKRPFSESDYSPRRSPKRAQKVRATKLRIVAGDLGGRRIEYDGNPDTRPMKEKTREAVFSLLGGYLHDRFAIDLFAGTGVLGFESISRGASGSLMLELSRPVVSTLLDNMRSLGLEDVVQVQNVDTLRWLRTVESQTAWVPVQPWVVFCCPPYSLWTRQTDRIVEGLKQLYQCAPVSSRLVCETDFSFDLLAAFPDWDWDIRTYKPARVGLATKN
jgi:16S rRNA (guanine966-N2)-methyltransferase